MPSVFAPSFLSALKLRSAWGTRGGPSAGPRQRSRKLAHALQAPLVVWGLVLAVALLSFYVHLIQEQVQRGETLRQTQRNGIAQPVSVAQQAPEGPSAAPDRLQLGRQRP